MFVILARLLFFNHFAVLHLICLAVPLPAVNSSLVTTGFFSSLSLVSAVSGLVCWQQWLWHQPWPRRPAAGALLSTALAVEPSGEQRPPLPLRLVCLPAGVLLLLQLSYLPSLPGVLLLLSVFVRSSARPLVCLSSVKACVYGASYDKTDECAAVNWFQETVGDRIKPTGQRRCSSCHCFRSCVTQSACMFQNRGKSNSKRVCVSQSMSAGSGRCYVVRIGLLSHDVESFSFSFSSQSFHV